jgi:hypothetical protein
VDSASARSLTTLIGVLVATVGGCSSDTSSPTTLVDGTPIEPPPVALEAPAPQVMTRVSVVSPEDVPKDATAGTCIAESDGVPTEAAVERIGTTGRSVTFRIGSGRALVACDGSGGRHEGISPWCGRAYGVLDQGRLSDPRLDVAGCTTAAGDPVAFAWFEPGSDTSYVAVRQPGHVEVYPTVGALPVRITTTKGISVEDSSAVFELSEHDASGALLRSETLEARVAG